jgi:hypothetical protein
MIPTRESNPDSPSRDAAFYTIPLLYRRAVATRQTITQIFTLDPA